MWEKFFSQMRNHPKEILKDLSKRERYKSLRTVPIPRLIFHAFSFFPPEKTKVVIVCKEPYWIEGLAMGLAYGVPTDCNTPLSLKNIFKEQQKDIGSVPKKHLEQWAEQGVLLLNLALTVKARRPGSDIEYWRTCTEELITKLSDLKENIVFFLWGKLAKTKEHLISRVGNHLVLKAGDPDDFILEDWDGDCPFSKANDFLKSKNITAINW